MRTVLIVIATVLTLTFAWSLAQAGSMDAHIPDGYTAFDLNQLADGETRFFGSGANVVTASRRGEEISIERTGDKPLDMKCNLGTDTCKVLTSINDPAARPMILFGREVTHECEGADCDVSAKVDTSWVPEGGEGKIVIEKEIVTCNDDGSDCETKVIKDVRDLGGKDGNVWVSESGAEIELPEGAKFMFSTDDGDGVHAMMLHGDAKNMEKFNLADLADGEARTFGANDHAVTASRTGELVTISRQGEEPLKMDCNVTTDSCTVLTSLDDPDARVMLMIAKQRSCVGGEGECEDHEALVLGDLPAGAHAHSVIKTKTIVCDDEDKSNCREEVKVIRGPGAGGREVIVIGDDESGKKRRMKVRTKTKD